MLSDLNEPVNLGNSQELSILDLAKTVISLTKSRSRVVHKDLPVDDPKVRRPDITRAKKELRWEPEVTFEEGLKKTINWFKSAEG